ncbi:PLP-dependent cysteine synthase family protein [Candidatus Bathyarchaeota archaeon]|nr:PLP-dependent cysteine synthase family protein [Candidatus Bathyarchaeota archaeon]
MKVASSVLDLIGNTPMLRFNKLVTRRDATIYAKLESSNIGGSVKDRTAKYLIEKAEASGMLTRDKIILEATSGNTGSALAMIAAVKGYRVTLVMAESVSEEKKKMAKAFDADVILSDGSKGTGGAVELKRKLLLDFPEKYVDVDQFSDSANILAHYQTTGQEIIEQLDGKVDSVVVGIGTAGTGVGISMRVKEYNPEARIIGVTPKLGVSISGLRNPDEYNPTKLFKKEYFDEVIEVTQDEIPKIIDVVQCIARHEGLLVGWSAGAIVYQAMKEARKIGRGKNVIAVIPDGGQKYLSTNLF